MASKVFEIKEETPYKGLTLYPAQGEDRPLIVFNTVMGDGEELWQALRALDAPDCNLLVAGLFALYAMYRCDCFARVASMSGSLWFPKFREYVLRHELMRKPEMLYMSLGDAEAKTKHAVLKTVQENTEAILQHYQELGVDVRWELNPGNHFRDVAMRSAKGIKAILEA